MTWKVLVMPKAEKRLARLPEKQASRIIEALETLEEDPFSLDFKRLEGREEWRLRIGGWRVIVRVLREELIFLVLDIGSRGDIYK